MTARTAALARTFVDTRSLVFWVMAALGLYGVVRLTPFVLQSAMLDPLTGMVAALIWAAYAVLFAVIIYRLELFERRSPVTMLGAYLWGAVVVAGIGLIASPAANELLAKLLPESTEAWVSAIAAGVVEEPLKMLGIVALAFIPGARINSAIDGLYYGLLVGLGFEVTESFLYSVAAGADQAGGGISLVVMTFVLRGVIGGLWNHPTFTAITGAGAGYFFASTASLAKRVTALVGTLAAAISLHIFFDSPVLESDNPLLPTIVKGLPILVLFIVLYRVAQRRERAVFDRVGREDVPAHLISEHELEILISRSARRKARKAARQQAGLAAGHATKRLQRRQSSLIASITEEGPDASRTAEVATEVDEARAVLESIMRGDDSAHV
jgi:RsiW-degrading membrane proteinase PrsW (M82 family)